MVYLNNDEINDLSSFELIPLKPNTTSEESTANLQLSIDSFDETIHVRLDPEIEKYSQKLQEYDGMILDIRHWLRDENTNENYSRRLQ